MELRKNASPGLQCASLWRISNCTHLYGVEHALLPPSLLTGCSERLYSQSKNFPFNRACRLGPHKKVPPQWGWQNLGTFKNELRSGSSKMDRADSYIDRVRFASSLRI